jgi:hypothetical protein
LTHFPSTCTCAEPSGLAGRAGACCAINAAPAATTTTPVAIHRYIIGFSFTPQIFAGGRGKYTRSGKFDS